MESCGFCVGMRKDDTALKAVMEVVIKEMIKDKFMWARCQDNLSRENMLEQLEQDVLHIITDYLSTK